MDASFYVALIVVIFGSHAFAHHNETCEQEETSFKNCMKRFFDSKRSTRQPMTVPQDEVERCFISNGCQKPYWNGSQMDADMERAKICKQQLRQKMQSALKECVETKSPDHILFADEDNRWSHAHENDQEKRIYYQRWAIAKQTQDITICPVSSNGEKVRDCLREAWKRPQTSDETEKWLKDICNARKDCLKNISIECQEHMNITRSYKCDCSRERSPILKKEFHDCVGVPATSAQKDENQDNFYHTHHCNTTCTD